MKYKELKETIVADLKRLTNVNRGGVILKYLLFNASFRITFWFRVGSYLKEKKNTIAKIIYLVVYAIYKHQQWLTGIQLPMGTKVGKGLTFKHFGCIVINGSATIGDYCTIFQGVTLGMSPKTGVPHIGNNVVLSSNVVVLGGVHIGDDTIVGANAVVTKDIPENSVAVGIPAKVISSGGLEYVDFYLKHQ